MDAVDPVVDLRAWNIETAGEFGICNANAIACLDDPARQLSLLCLRGHGESFAYSERFFKSDVRLSRTDRSLR